jgi:ATP/maltotriose-dependent transcriptional regulator MalT
MEFRTASQLYGLFNVIVAITITVIGCTLLSLIRRNSYSNSLIVQERGDEKMNVFFKEKGISKREGEIVRLIMAGKSNNEIEEELFISLTTVKSHIYKAYQKLGVKNRVQLIHVLQNVKKSV